VSTLAGQHYLAKNHTVVTLEGMTTFETVDDAAWFLHAAGWTPGEAQLLYPDGRLRWSVTATADGQDLRSEADTQTEAWRSVAEMAAELMEW
jgi:hypothetical protein